MNPNDPRLDWLRDYAEGTADADTMRQLEAALHEDVDLRMLLVEYLNVDLALAANASLTRPEIVRAPRWRRFLRPVARVAAVIAILAAATWMLMRPEVSLQRVVGDQAAGLPLGEWVGQVVELRTGLVELGFRKADATVVIEAPAMFRVEDAKTLRMESGRMTAHVRDGRQGLRVLTPHTDVLDLGTRFAVDVSSAGRSEVHVFEGKVVAGRAGEVKRESLTTNQALRFAPSTLPESREMRSGTFVQPEEMKALAAGMRAGQRRRANEAETLLRRDAALIGFIGFESAADESAVAVQGAHQVQGRFPGQQALEFVDTDDHARLNLNATTRKLTLMTWVRLDRVPDEVSSLYHTDGWQTDGQVHWMILNNGQMRFAMKGVPLAKWGHGKGGWPQSAGTVAGELGRWMHLAAVYDADTASVSFYRDGRFDSKVDMRTGLPAVLGPAQIGNWDIKHQFGTEHRRLSGRMDELIALSRCLSAEEILNFYQAGNPYR